LKPGPAAKSQVAVGSAVFSSAGKSRSPIELELALLDQLERDRRGDDLGHRHDAEVRVDRDRVLTARDAWPGGALVDDPVAVCRDRGDARDGSVGDRPLEDLVDAGV
jgi:hypothetical protein